MKLVAGIKLKKAEQKAANSREYATELALILSKIHRKFVDGSCELFSGRNMVQNEMLVVFASEKGLCGNFNYVIGKKTAEIISGIHQRGGTVHLICIGVKPFEFLKQKLIDGDRIELLENFYLSEALLENSNLLATRIMANFSSGRVDQVAIVYTRCLSAISRKVEVKSLIPIVCTPDSSNGDIIFEPSTEEILQTIVPYNIAIQIYQSALESVAGEQGSRMTSMDNATRNADELLSNLTISYNRTRQYRITQELVEVVSGATTIAKG
jgi:F-type H+-transporting ATPase subunit gamma